MIATARKLLELIRFSHTLFALPFALLSAALAFNRLVDRRFDAANPRTANRHLPAGTLSLKTVAAFTILTSVGFFASTLIFLLRDPANPWPAYLAVPVLCVLLGYSLTKRFTSLAHFWLGLSLMLAPVAAWIAVRGMADLASPLLLGAAVLFWVAGFDILYACQDADFDRSAKLHSVPAKLGVKTALRIAAICHVAMFGWLVALGFASPFLGPIYALGLAGVGALLVVQHWLVKPDDLTRVNVAFFRVNAIISFGLLAVVLLQLWWT